MDNEEELDIMAKTLEDMSVRIGETLDYIDWLASITGEEEAPYLEQIYKLLEGAGEEH